MFKRLSRGVAAVCTAAALGIATLAQGAAPTNTDLPRSVGELMNMSPMEVMHQMDADHSGMITKEEYLKYFSDLWDRMDKEHASKVPKEVFMSGWAARNK
jgi:hypothetical protein